MGHQPLRIRIAAIAVSGALLGLSLGIAAVPPPAAAASASIKLGVLIVQMGAKADPGLKSQLTADLFGVTGSVKAELAAEGVTLTGAVLGPVSISAPCDFDSIAGAAYAKAERQKIPVAKYPYTTFVVVAPENGCQADTLGELGGRWNVVAGSSPSVILHEFGHNLGFMHANRLDCTGKHDYRAIPGSESGCVSQEYHDTYSIMGAIVNSGTGVGLDAWRLSSLGSKVIGSPARIPAANHTIQLSFLDAAPGTAGARWATLPLKTPKGWRLSLELARGLQDEVCPAEPGSLDRSGGADDVWAGCGPAVVLRLLPPGSARSGQASYLVAALGLGDAFHDVKRDWSVRFAALEGDTARVTIWDATPPSAPTGVTASHDDRLIVSWSASPDAEAALSYEIGGKRHSDPEPMVLGTTTEMTWSSDHWGTYADGFWVRAVDLGGNASPWVEASEG